MEAMEVVATTMEEVEVIMEEVEVTMVAVGAMVEVTHLDALSDIQDVMMTQSSKVRRSCALNNSPQVVEEEDPQLDGGKVSRVEEVRNLYRLLVNNDQ